MLVIAHISCTKYTVLQWAFIWQKMCAIYIRIDFFTNTYILHLDLKYCLWQTNARMLGRSKRMSEIQRNHRVRLTFKSRRCWLHWDVIAWSRNTWFVMFYADVPWLSYIFPWCFSCCVTLNRGQQRSAALPGEMSPDPAVHVSEFRNHMSHSHDCGWLPQYSRLLSNTYLAHGKERCWTWTRCCKLPVSHDLQVICGGVWRSNIP